MIYKNCFEIFHIFLLSREYNSPQKMSLQFFGGITVHKISQENHLNHFFQIDVQIEGLPTPTIDIYIRTDPPTFRKKLISYPK